MTTCHRFAATSSTDDAARQLDETRSSTTRITVPLLKQMLASQGRHEPVLFDLTTR